MGVHNIIFIFVHFKTEVTHRFGVMSANRVWFNEGKSISFNVFGLM